MYGKYVGRRLTAARQANDEITNAPARSEIVRSGCLLFDANRLTNTPEMPKPRSAIVTVR
jgi:hypothetical protein